VSRPRWAPERPSATARAATLIAAAFPTLRGRPVEPLAEGWDNTVFLVGGTWVFRFPRRQLAVPGFRRELAVLPRIATRLPLPVPEPEFVADDDDPVDPWPFAGARLLPGRELADTGLPDGERRAAAAAVGAFLRQLHAAPTRQAAPAGLPLDPMGRAWPRARIDDTRTQLRQLVEQGTWAGDPGVQALLAEAERLDAPARPPVLVHGDLHVRHVLLDDGGSAVGVLDWGDVCLADPAVDLALAYTAFSGPARAAFLTAYGEVDAERELRARALGVRLSAFLTAYAADVDRPALLAEALAGLRRVVG
jgi:aminoglycoside phosphotransferase (APT) family kinase protein